MRAIEKTVSSLIPPTATFRLPTAWQRIGSVDSGEKEREGAKVIGEECEGERRKGKGALNNHMRYSHPVISIPFEHVRSQFLRSAIKWDSSDLFLYLLYKRESAQEPLQLIRGP